MDGYAATQAPNKFGGPPSMGLGTAPQRERDPQGLQSKLAQLRAGLSELVSRLEGLEGSVGTDQPTITGLGRGDTPQPAMQTAHDIATQALALLERCHATVGNIQQAF